MGGKKKGKELVVETPELAVQVEQTLPPEPTETPNVAVTTETASDHPTTSDETPTTHDVSTPTEEADTSPAPADEPTKKHRKLNVKADLKPKKLSMIAAAL